jgi:hypothetical protein
MPFEHVGNSPSADRAVRHQKKNRSEIRGAVRNGWQLINRLPLARPNLTMSTIGFKRSRVHSTIASCSRFEIAANTRWREYRTQRELSRTTGMVRFRWRRSTWRGEHWRTSRASCTFVRRSGSRELPHDSAEFATVSDFMRHRYCAPSYAEEIPGLNQVSGTSGLRFCCHTL